MDRRTFLAAGVAGLAGTGAAVLFGAHSSGATTTTASRSPASARLPGSGPMVAVPSRREVLAVARRVDDAWIAGHPDPGDNGWANATYHSGNMKLYGATGRRRYLARATTWGEKHGYGLKDGTDNRHADDHCAGQTYYDLYDVEPDPARIKEINESLRLMVEGPEPDKIDDWHWVDALHMAPPVFVRVGLHTGDERYLAKLRALYQDCKRGRTLFDEKLGLWYRDQRFAPWTSAETRPPTGKFVRPGGKEIKSPNGLPVTWSRGNGWAFAGHAKVHALLGDEASRWPEYGETLRQMAAALAGCQRPDGFWNVNLTDPDHLPGPETSGTAFFVFGLAYGVRCGLLDRTTYLPVAVKGWNALAGTAVQADGSVGYVQGVVDRPEASQPITSTSTRDLGVGAFLMAASEMAALTATS